MLIGLYIFIVNVVFPQIATCTKLLFEPVVVIAITLAGIIMMFGAVGMKISNNLGSTIVNGIFRGIGYLFQTLFRAISWIVRSTIQLLPKVFAESKKTFVKMGLRPVLSNVLAVLVTALTLAIII